MIKKTKTNIEMNKSWTKTKHFQRIKTKIQNYHKSGEKPTARSTHHVAGLSLYLVEKLKIYE